jgi:chemotaxis protein CheD
MAELAIQSRVSLLQGEYRVSDNPGLVVTTILGSCVAACLRDPHACVGGMNHFLLPGSAERDPDEEAERYGVHLMELLVNGLLHLGAKRNRLEAKLFGGGRIVEGLSDVGAMNVRFAKHFLELEGIKLIGGSVEGTRGRRVEFRPVSGQARQIYIDRVEMPELNVKLPPPPKPQAPSGVVEFF